MLPDEVAAARAEDLGRIDTFEFEEQKVYAAALAALADGRWEVARTWSQERLDGSSFWIELRGSLRRPAWELVQAVATLGQTLATAGPALAADSLAAAVQRYVTCGAAVDQAHRALEQRWHGVSGALLPEREELRARVVRTRELWHAWAEAWARGFSALCKAQGFVPGPALQQRTLFEEVVRPMTAQPGTTVIFLVDALRYEMAEALRREIGEPGATTIELRARLAELPTITAVGMNALAPVAERGKLRPAVRDGAIVGMQRGEYRVDNPDSRQRAMHERVDKDQVPVAHARRGAGRGRRHAQAADRRGQAGARARRRDRQRGREGQRPDGVRAGAPAPARGLEPAARGGGAQVRDHGGPRLPAARRRGPPGAGARAEDRPVATARDLGYRGRPCRRGARAAGPARLRGRRRAAADDARGYRGV
jgi:hypothetical protein